MSRRKRAVLVAASALTAVLASPAAVPTQAQQTPIRHVVVIYLENHTFDNLLGFWCNNHPGRCPDGGMPSSVTLSNGAVVTPSTDPDVVPNIRHETTDQQAAINGGLMNGWQNVRGCGAPKYACVSGYQPWQIPNITLLSRDFAISDMTFSMQNSPSWFGHLYAVAATTDGFTGHNPQPASGVTPGKGWGCDSNLVAQWAATPGGATQSVPSCIPDPSLGLPNGGAFEPTPVSYVPTIMDRLNAAGLSWRIYGEPAPGFSGTKGLQNYGSEGYIWDICPSFAECLDSQQHANNVLAAQFIPDAAAGNLPAFSVVTPGGADPSAPLGTDVTRSCHNSFSMTACDNWVGQLVSAVMNGPDWGSTAIFVTWDDCGCFYDQVPPGTNPDGTPQGPRIPVIIISPYAKAGFTDTTPTTFSGILAYTEQTFGLSPLGVNDAGAYPFSNAFNYSQPPLGGLRMTTRPVPKGGHIIWSQQDS